MNGGRPWKASGLRGASALLDTTGKAEALGQNLDTLGTRREITMTSSFCGSYLAEKTWGCQGLALLDVRISQRQSELCVQAERIALEALCKTPGEFIEQFAMWLAAVHAAMIFHWPALPGGFQIQDFMTLRQAPRALR
jgi:hypothetical protein